MKAFNYLRKLPTAKPFKLDSVHVWINCPLCKEVHKHGAAGGRYWGNRVCHCIKLPMHAEYYIERNKDIEKVI